MNMTEYEQAEPFYNKKKQKHVQTGRIYSTNQKNTSCIFLNDFSDTKKYVIRI